MKFKVRYTLARGQSEPEEKPDVVLVGSGRRLVYRRGRPTPARLLNQKDIKFTEVGQALLTSAPALIVYIFFTFYFYLT